MIPPWLSNLGNNTYSWVENNPMDALALGMGAVGTGMGMYDQAQANQRMDKRQKLAESLMRGGSKPFEPNWSPEDLNAQYFRPASHFMAGQGQFDGGSFRQHLADAGVKARADQNRIGIQNFGTALGALGYGQPQGASGNTNALGSALQNIMIRRALAGSPMGVGRNLMQAPPGATWGGSFGGGDGYDRNYSGNPFDGQIPPMQLFGGGMFGESSNGGGAGPGDGRWGGSSGYSLTNFGPAMSLGGTNASPSVAGFYPDDAFAL